MPKGLRIHFFYIPSLKTRDYIYIVEVKIDNTADAALQQIEDKGYAKPFANEPRKLFKIGVGFSTGNRRIEDWKVVAGPDFDLES